MLSLTNKEDLKSHSKIISEDEMKNFNETKISEELNNAIINQEKSSEENFDNQDLSQGTRMENERTDVIILYNDRPQQILYDCKPESEARKKDLKSCRKLISENNHAIINREISSVENLKNQDLSNETYGRGDILLFDGGLQRKERGQDTLDDENNGLELTPDEQAERVNLFLLGFASIILMNAMAVLIIVLVRVSEYEDQLVIKSSIMKKQIKGM